MRCNECNVDLGEEYTVCPLCHSSASHDEPVLKNIKTAAYPNYSELSGAKSEKTGIAALPKYLFIFSAAVCVILFAAALFGNSVLFEKAVPAVIIINAAVCFAFSLFEKGRLLHGAIDLLAVLAFSVVFNLLGLIFSFAKAGNAIALLISLGLFLLLWALKPEKMTQQIKAFFIL